MRALFAVADDHTALDARAEAARRTIVECDRRLTQHRKALEAGADASIVTDWIGETSTVRALAERDLADATPPPPLSEEQLTKAIAELTDLVPRIVATDRALRAKALHDLGVRVYWKPGSDEIDVTVKKPQLEPARGSGSVGGGT